jgi:hypothetical protein
LANKIFLETDKEKIDALLYTAIFNEINRLQSCSNKKERQSIRDFILKGYKDLKSND